MSNDPTRHPDLEQLAAFDGGRLSPSRREAIERHVAGCESCCRRLETMPEDAFTATVRAFAGCAGSLESPGPGRPELPAGLVGHPRYRVLGEIGRGGMGVVWKAVQLLLDRVVALKVIHPHLASRPGFAEHFHNEVRALARLNHPHIAQAHDADGAGDLLFLVMEYVDGVGLDQLVAQRGPLPVGQAIELARQAALGLLHAHERGILHRDLKPHNLILTSDGVVKIVDFGLAQLVREGAVADGARSAPVLGTPDYMAPEQARDSRSADGRSDLYGLGCTLYHLLAGQVPFPGGTVLQKLMRHQEGSARSIRDLRPDVPGPLAALLARLLDRNPARRPASAAEVARELASLANPALSRRPPHRGRALLVSAAVALVLVGAGITALAWPRDKGDSEREEPETLVGQPGPPAPSPPRSVAPAQPAPALAGPAQVIRRKKAARDRALDWLRQNNRWGPKGDIVAHTARDIDNHLERSDGYQLTLGGRLLKSGRPAILAVRLGDLFSFELTPAQADALEVKTNRRSFRSFFKGKEARRVKPGVRLSGLEIDHAGALPRQQRITGKVSYEGLQEAGERPHIRLTYYPFPMKKRRIGLYYLRSLPPPASARLTFDFGALGDLTVQKGPVVMFVELACLHGGQEVVESNTLAVLVTPLDLPRAQTREQDGLAAPDND